MKLLGGKFGCVGKIIYFCSCKQDYHGQEINKRHAAQKRGTAIEADREGGGDDARYRGTAAIGSEGEGNRGSGEEHHLSRLFQ